MSLSDIVDGWAHQSVTFETPGTPDAYGNPSTGTATTYQAILIQRTKLVQDREGRQVVSSCQILLNGSASINPESKVTLPDGTQPRIINTGSTPYFDGVNCVTEVYT